MDHPLSVLVQAEHDDTAPVTGPGSVLVPAQLPDHRPVPAGIARREAVGRRTA